MELQNQKPTQKLPHFVTDDGRTHLRTPLMRESLVSSALQARLAENPNDEVNLLPWAKLINIGGCILDRGATALLPLLEAVVAARDAGHPIIVSVGGGARMRHTLEIGMDLGLPIGGLAQIVGAVEEQNSHMVHAILSKQGGVSMCREHFAELPKYLLTGMIPIVISVPPYHFWEPPPREGNIPENGSDLGAFMTSEVLGVSQMLFIKDQEGQFTEDPERVANAKLLEQCHVADLVNKPAEDLLLERSVLHALNRARNVRSIRVINGLNANNLKRALDGETIGTHIEQDPR
ncbi:MAG: uridine kinase [Myxococcota bacterium]